MEKVPFNVGRFVSHEVKSHGKMSGKVLSRPGCRIVEGLMLTKPVQVPQPHPSTRLLADETTTVVWFSVEILLQCFQLSSALLSSRLRSFNPSSGWTTVGCGKH